MDAIYITSYLMFQHTATRRWLLFPICSVHIFNVFQHTATRRWLLFPRNHATHCKQSFNTQPPEGGCSMQTANSYSTSQFQHTATRRWLQFISLTVAYFSQFQHTATRRWLRINPLVIRDDRRVSTHSHPKVAASFFGFFFCLINVSTHSHPKVAAGRGLNQPSKHYCFNTQPPEGGCMPDKICY